MINKRQEVSTESLTRHERGEKVVLVVELINKERKSLVVESLYCYDW